MNETSFLSSLSALFSKIEEKQKVKKQAWDRFLEIDLPTRKTETYRYVPLTDLYSKEYAFGSSSSDLEIEPFIYEACQQSVLVFINGVFSSNFSRIQALPSELRLLSLEKAFQSFSSFLPAQFSDVLNEERDAFSALNAALYSQGLFIYLPPNLSCTVPLQILHIQDASMVAPRLHLFLGKNSSLNVHVREVHRQSSPSWKNGVMDCSVEEGAKLHLTTLNSGLENGWQTEAFRIRLKKDAKFTGLNYTSGGKTTRQDFRIQLKGEGAEASVEGLWYLKDAKHAHTNVLIEHEAPFTRSLQKFKGVLKDEAQASFEGKIFVKKEALKTEAFQVNHNLLLSDDARCFVKPHLEIFADDVKATHGATVGQLNLEELFYLKSRGLSSELASQVLLKGFCQEIFDKLSLADERKIVLEYLNG